MAIPAGRQRGHAHVGEQPGGKEDDQRITIDKGDHQGKESENPDAAVDQAAVALELALRVVKAGGVPALDRQAPRTRGIDPAQHRAGRAIETESAQRLPELTAAPVAVGDAETLARRLTPALDAPGMARGKEDGGRRSRDRRACLKRHPERRFRQPRLQVARPRHGIQRSRDLRLRQDPAVVPQHPEFDGVDSAKLVGRLPGQERPHGKDGGGQGNEIERQRAKQPVADPAQTNGRRG